MDAAVVAAARRDAGRVGEDGIEPGGDEDEPEVRRLVLPVDVGRRAGEQDNDAEQRRGEGAGEDQPPAAQRSASRARYAWTPLTASAPEPAAAATRLTEPERTSPAAKTPGILVSRLGPVTT